MSPVWRGLVLLGAVGGLAVTQPATGQAGLIGKLGVELTSSAEQGEETT